MNKIKRITDPLEGPPDGVMADVQCVLTQFETKEATESEETQRTMTGQGQTTCHVFCAYSDGTIGFSLRDIDLMISLRIDELYAILAVASQAANELTDSMPLSHPPAVGWGGG
jgi:hypothetical protein